MDISGDQLRKQAESAHKDIIKTQMDQRQALNFLETRVKTVSKPIMDVKTAFVKNRSDKSSGIGSSFKMGGLGQLLAKDVAIKQLGISLK